MRKKIVIFGHYGVPNWGDEAILSGILSQINIANFSVTVISHNPEFTKKNYSVHSAPPPPFGIRSFFKFQWIETLQIIKESDYIIIGGGGLWQPRPLKAMKVWNFYLRICLFFDKKVFSLGTSFAVFSENAKNKTHIKNSEYKKIINTTAGLLQKIKFFSVRDKKSKQILMNTYNIHEAKISVTADAAFFLANKNSTTISSKKIVLLAMREGDLSIEQEKVIIYNLYKKFNPKQYQYKFLVMQSHQSHDENFIPRHSTNKCVIHKICPENIEQLLEIISHSEFVCSSRLHANVLASVSNTKFLAISCRDKVKNLFLEHLPENIIESKNIKNTKKSILIFSKKLEKAISHERKSENNSFLEIQKKKLQNFFPDILR